MEVSASTPRRVTSVLAATFAASVTLATGPSAHANPINCDASALRVTVLGTAVEPVTANRGKTACVPFTAPALVDTTKLGIPLVASVLTAQTNAGGDHDTQRAIAIGGATNLAIGRLPSLGLPDVSTLIPDALKTVSISLAPISAVANPILALAGLPPLPSSIDIGLAAAIKDLVQPLPDVAVLSAGALNAFAGARCVNGAATPFAAPQIADVSVLGQTVGADGLVNGALPVLNTQSIDLSKLDLTKVVLPKVITDLGLSVLTQPVLALVNGLVQTTLGALPPISVPAVLADVSVRPGVKTTSGTVVTQHALDVHVALLGQTLLDGVIGEARVNTAGVDCTPAPAAAPEPTGGSDLVLQCTKRRVVLTDVYRRGRAVVLVGAADRKLVGKTVRIRFDADGSTAATTTVKPDGSFTARAPLPARRLRDTNRARYTAIVAGQKSLNLKLMRRMSVTSMTSAGGTVTITGKVSRPLGSPVQTIKVQQRLSCRKTVTVKTIRPRRDGTFTVTVAAPDGQTAAVYRLATKVRKTERNPKLFPTFTLPRGVNLS